MNFKKELTENILPFWLNNAIDWENSGILPVLTEKGIYTEGKRACAFKDVHCGSFRKRIIVSIRMGHTLKRQKIFTDFYQNVLIPTAECFSP